MNQFYRNLPAKIDYFVYNFLEFLIKLNLSRKLIIIIQAVVCKEENFDEMGVK